MFTIKGVHIHAGYGNIIATVVSASGRAFIDTDVKNLRWPRMSTIWVVEESHNDKATWYLGDAYAEKVVADMHAKRLNERDNEAICPIFYRVAEYRRVHDTDKDA